MLAIGCRRGLLTEKQRGGKRERWMCMGEGLEARGVATRRISESLRAPGVGRVYI